MGLQAGAQFGVDLPFQVVRDLAPDLYATDFDNLLHFVCYHVRITCHARPLVQAPATDAFWGRTLERLKRDGKTILVGANVSDAETPHYFNAIIIRGANRQRNFLQRIPIPIAMWAPYGKRGVPLRLGGAGTLNIAGRRAAVLICYEHLLIWPILTSFAQHPTVLLEIANDYCAHDTSVAAIQRSCLTSAVRLF